MTFECFNSAGMRLQQFWKSRRPETRTHVAFLRFRRERPSLMLSKVYVFFETALIRYPGDAPRG